MYDKTGGKINQTLTPLKTPILFLTFNRPDTARLVFSEIIKVRPAQLFIAQDGPRKNKPGEAEKCRNNRRMKEQITTISVIVFV